MRKQTNYLDQLTVAQRAILMKPMDWKATTAKLERNLAVAKPKYRDGIEQMLRVARANVAE